jgi:uncharacterized protein YkwD
MKVSALAPVIWWLSLIFSSPAAHAQAKGSAEILFAAANRERVARGLLPLKWSSSLTNAARLHVMRLAERNILSHQLPGEPSPSDRAAQADARFSSFAENVAEGPNAEGIHRQWMNSPPHRANLLDPHLDSIGIAVAEREGTLFAVEDFSLEIARLSLTEHTSLPSCCTMRQRTYRLCPTSSSSDCRQAGSTALWWARVRVTPS